MPTQETTRSRNSPVLTEDMKRLIREQPLGYVATIAPDGGPAVSPKATFVRHGRYGRSHMAMSGRPEPAATSEPIRVSSKLCRSLCSQGISSLWHRDSHRARRQRI